MRDEPYECVVDAPNFIEQLKSAKSGADLFTFSQGIGETEPRYNFPLEWDNYAVLPITTYDNWFKNQIDFKTRNKVRKCSKNGVELRVSELTDDFVRGVQGIYDESPFVQGRKNWHYGKSLEEMKNMLGTFPERRMFVGSYLKDEMIGFIKLVYGGNVVHFMHIISKVAHRDKAPTNALLAKAIEIAAGRKAAYLHFGIWSRRGLGVFKMNHSFIEHKVPRDFVPLTLQGNAMLKLTLHRSLKSRIPEDWIDRLVEWRNRWNAFRQRKENREAYLGARSAPKLEVAAKQMAPKPQERG